MKHEKFQEILEEFTFENLLAEGLDEQDFTKNQLSIISYRMLDVAQKMVEKFGIKGVEDETKSE